MQLRSYGSTEGKLLHHITLTQSCDAEEPNDFASWLQRPEAAGMNTDAQALVRQLLALRAPPALHAAASSACGHDRWWGMLSSIAVQHTVGGHGAGRLMVAAGQEPAFDRVHVHALAKPDGPNRLPLRRRRHIACEK